MQFITFIFVLHIILIIAVFDVYFQSSVLQNIPSNQNKVGSFAKRLVLFVGDGLRSDIFFGERGNVNHSPFLRSLIQRGAPWGVSNTRVPTESRPGHVAIVAGIYEDPSAVFKGWKENPVNFDSVFNQSRATFSWGSPDIVPMFRNENSNPDIHCYTYSSEEQDFSGRNGSVFFLNNWVLDDFKSKLALTETDLELRSLWNQPGVVFFFHLLSIDVAGHLRNPKSDYYEDAILNTDQVVQNITSMIDDFFSDKRTAYIFTSDHGMTDWGSHGDGSTSETETPLVAWGAGIKSTDCKDIEYTVAHKYSVCNQNINQADLAVLMSILLGHSIPVNSEGILPVEYLKADKEKAALALHLNGLQLLNKFNRKQELVRSNLASFFYKPFASLNEQEQSYLMYMTTFMIDKGSYTKLKVLANLIINRSLKGLRYYDRYYQDVKLLFLTALFIGLIFLTLGQIMPYFSPLLTVPSDSCHSMANLNLGHMGLWMVGLPTVGLILVGTSTLPLTFTVYILVPVPVWFYAVINSVWVKKLCGITFNGFCRMLLYATATSFIFWSFYHRWILSLLMLLMTLWLIFERASANGSFHLVLWTASSFFIGMFTYLPTMTMSSISVISCAILWLVAGVCWIWYSGEYRSWPRGDRWLLAKLLFMIVTLMNMCHINERFSSGGGITYLNQATSYFCLAFYFISLFFCCSNNKAIPSFISVTLSLSMMFLLFCSGIECFFPFVFAFHLAMWITFETSVSDIMQEKIFVQVGKPFIRTALTEDDIRRSFFYLCYIVLSFFGMGNIDSLSSFNIAWVRGFVSTFSPFLMTALIIIKIIVPFIMAACAFKIVVIRTQANVYRMFLIVLVFCNLLALKFLHNVTNEGSWLQIGKSISHFIIVEVTVLVLIVLHVLTSFIIRQPMEKHWVLPISKLHSL